MLLAGPMLLAGRPPAGRTALRPRRAAPAGAAGRAVSARGEAEIRGDGDPEGADAAGNEGAAAVSAREEAAARCADEPADGAGAAGVADRPDATDGPAAPGPADPADGPAAPGPADPADGPGMVA